jgi:hypothetical protein
MTTRFAVQRFHETSLTRGEPPREFLAKSCESALLGSAEGPVQRLAAQRSRLVAQLGALVLRS